MGVAEALSRFGVTSSKCAARAASIVWTTPRFVEFLRDQPLSF
jgi:hypothetical protein